MVGLRLEDALGLSEKKGWTWARVVQTKPPKKRKREPVHWRIVDVREGEGGLLLIASPEWQDYKNGEADETDDSRR